MAYTIYGGSFMKKVVYVMVIVALVLSVGVVGVFAASETRGKNFIDANSDGVCDNATDEDGDGVCDNCPNDGIRPLDGTGKQNRNNNGNGAGFVDEDGDGVCDNKAGRAVCPRDGTGSQNQNGRRMGRKNG
jgi:hypothetical protein